MAIPLLDYAPSSQNNRVAGYEVGGDEQPIVFTTANLPSSTSLDQLIEAAYRQIFFSVFKAEHDSVLESQLRDGRISTRDFIRGLLLSKTYRENFFDKNSNYGFVEQTVRRVLGRDVYSEKEKIAWSIVVATLGIQGFVDQLLDSDEYIESFGYDTVPYQRRRVISGRNSGTVPFNIKSVGDQRGTGKTLPFEQTVWQNTNAVSKKVESRLPLLSYAPSSQNVRVRDITKGSDESSRVFTTENVPFSGLINRADKVKVFNNVTVASLNDLDEIVEAAYRQIFFYAFKTDRQSALESKFRNREITTRDFIRGLLLSETYKDSFYEKNSNYRFVELTVQKVLGRPVYSQREKIAWSIVVVNKGIAGFADELLNSQEYLENFGYDKVPYQRRRVVFGRAEGERPFDIKSPRYDGYHRGILGFPQIIWQNEVRTFVPQERKPTEGNPALYKEMAKSLNLPPISTPKTSASSIDYLSQVPRR